MNEKVFKYLASTRLFSLNECKAMSNQINPRDNINYIQEILLTYFGGEDDYAYETTITMAEDIKRL